jgi:hypothetical protein
MVKVNTQNILFIAGGAFDGLEKIISRRLNTHVIGYGSLKRNLLTRITSSNMFHRGPSFLWVNSRTGGPVTRFRVPGTVG